VSPQPIRAEESQFDAQAALLDFLTTFRSGEWTDPLISSIERLSVFEAWYNIGTTSRLVGKALETSAERPELSSRQESLAERLLVWRSQNVDAFRLRYHPLDDSTPLPQNRTASLITDFRGGFVSSYRPDVILNRYLDAIHGDGEIYIYLGNDQTGMIARSTVVTRTGQHLPLRKWLRSLPGLEVTPYRGGNPYSGMERSFIRIRIRKASAAQVPPLQLIGLGEMTSDGIPRAIFKE
jgi:hypothetical protein